MSGSLHLVGVVKAYAATQVLRDISLQVEEGEYVTVLGSSGSGKSTMLRVVAGFERPDSGRVRIGGDDVTLRPAHQRGVGFVFQSFALIPHLNVFDNVAFGLRHRTVNPVADEAVLRRQVFEMLELVGLAGFERRRVTEISGGQKQRVALARCLVGQPRIVLLDEPLGALDANLRAQMTGELSRIQRHLGATFVHVTGNEQEALAMGGRVAVLDNGIIVQFDRPRVVFERPRTARVARLLNTYNLVDHELHRSRGADKADPVPSGQVWLIRSDQVGVSVADAAPAELAGVRGQYVASEYEGARVVALFDVGAGRHFEVEYHLGHSQPPELVAGRSYALTWNPRDAISRPLES